MEKLYELVEEGGFDLVVVDTPPSRNALDFLDAPAAADPLSGEPDLPGPDEADPGRAQVHGGGGPGPAPDHLQGGRADIVRDAVSFFQAFEGMEEGFRTRAARVRELLGQEGTAFVLVASPRPDSVDEAVHFAGKLAESGMSVTALVVNRVQPRFADDAQLDVAAPVRPVATGPALDAARSTTCGGYTAASDREERGLRRPGGQGRPGPRLPGAPAQRRRPRSGRTGHHRRSPVRRPDRRTGGVGGAHRGRRAGER